MRYEITTGYSLLTLNTYTDVFDGFQSASVEQADNYMKSVGISLKSGKLQTPTNQKTNKVQTL